VKTRHDSNLLVEGIAAVLGGDESLHARIDGGIDQRLLRRDNQPLESGDDCIGAFEGGDQRLVGRIVGCDDSGALWDFGAGSGA
jgi:hypothetical protein